MAVAVLNFEYSPFKFFFTSSSSFLRSGFSLRFFFRFSVGIRKVHTSNVSYVVSFCVIRLDGYMP